MSHPYPKSSAVGIGILGILVLISGVIFHQQARFNPAVKVLSESATPDSRALGQASAPQKGAGTAPSESSTALTDSAILRPTAPLSPLSSAEHFDEVTLSDKIDGKAELYLPSGFKSLICQRFTSQGSDIWLEVFIFDMGNAENAFSVFSRQRRDKVTPLDLAPYAYQTENAIFLTHGHFYLEMIASAPSLAAIGWMVDLAQAFISDHPALSQKTMDVPTLFPLDLLDKGQHPGPKTAGTGQGPGAEKTRPMILDQESITLITTDAFGFDRLDQVYTAGYLVHGEAMSAFISKRGSRQEALKLAEDYSRFLMEFGGRALDLPKMDPSRPPRPVLHAVEIMDTVEVVFSVGPFLAGVRDAKDLKTALPLVQALMGALPEAP